MVGQRVSMMASDHPHAGQSGVVIAHTDCEVCGRISPKERCGYDDLIVLLDDGTETRVYSIETEPA